MDMRTAIATERAFARAGAERVLLTHERASLTASMRSRGVCDSCGQEWPCAPALEATRYLRGV